MSCACSISCSACASGGMSATEGMSIVSQAQMRSVHQGRDRRGQVLQVVLLRLYALGAPLVGVRHARPGRRRTGTRSRGRRHRSGPRRRWQPRWRRRYPPICSGGQARRGGGHQALELHAVEQLALQALPLGDVADHRHDDRPAAEGRTGGRSLRPRCARRTWSRCSRSKMACFSVSSCRQLVRQAPAGTPEPGCRPRSCPATRRGRSRAARRRPGSLRRWRRCCRSWSARARARRRWCRRRAGGSAPREAQRRRSPRQARRCAAATRSSSASRAASQAVLRLPARDGHGDLLGDEAERRPGRSGCRRRRRRSSGRRRRRWRRGRVDQRHAEVALRQRLALRPAYGSPSLSSRTQLPVVGQQRRYRVREHVLGQAGAAGPRRGAARRSRPRSKGSDTVSLLPVVGGDVAVGGGHQAGDGLVDGVVELDEVAGFVHRLGHGVEGAARLLRPRARRGVAQDDQAPAEAAAALRRGRSPGRRSGATAGRSPRRPLRGRLVAAGLTRRRSDGHVRRAPPWPAWPSTSA